MHGRPMGQDTGSDRGATRGLRAQRREFNMSTLFIFCFVVYWNQHAVHCESYEQFLGRTLPDLCPYSTFCTMTPSKQLDRDKYSPCCKSCSCDDDCQLLGNCCPDFSAITTSNHSMKPIAKCVVPIHYNYNGFTNFTNESADKLGLHSFYVFKTCPDGYNNGNVIRKCMHSDMQDHRDMVMVSDAGGRVFHNRYCAKCNGVTHFTQWNLKLLCKHVGFTWNDVFNTKQLADQQCSIISSPPDEINAVASRCFQTNYDKCNVTGKWKRFDSNIKRACESTSFPYVNEVQFATTTVFNNPYCYICNFNRATVHKEQKCQKDIVDHEKTNLDVSFSAIFSNIEELPDVSSSSKCPSTNRFDHHFGTCRPLHCPSTMIPRDGKCVPFFTQVTGLSKFIQVNANFAQALNDSDYNYFFGSVDGEYRTIEDFAQGLATDIGVHHHKCTVCTGEWLRRKDGTGVTLLLGFETNQHCSTSTLIETINLWRLKVKRSPGFYIKKNGEQISFSFEMSYDISSLSPKSDAHFEQRYYFFWRTYKSCQSYAFLEPKFYCPYFDIPRNDYINLKTTENNEFHAMDFTAVSIRNSTSNETESTYRICIDEYLGEPNSGTSSSPYFINITTMTTWFAMFSCFRYVLF